eukprot:scaffold36314_cov139-Isochrysis_galbana.AAC.2
MQQHTLITVGDMKARIPALPVMKEILVRADAPLSYIDAFEQWLGIKFNLLPTTANQQTAAHAGGGGGANGTEASSQAQPTGYRGARFMTKNGQTLGELLYAAKRLDELVIPLGLYAGMPEPGPALLVHCKATSQVTKVVTKPRRSLFFESIEFIVHLQSSVLGRQGPNTEHSVHPHALMQASIV